NTMSTSQKSLGSKNPALSKGSKIDPTQHHIHLNPYERKKVIKGNAFTARSSTLDLEALEREQNPFRGFLTLFWMGMAVYVMYTMYTNWRREGIPLRLNFLNHISLDGWGLAVSDAVLVLSCGISVVITKLYIAGWIPKSAILIVQNVWQASWFATCVYWVFHRDWPWVQSGFFVMHSISMLMKQHSYIATNREFLLKQELLASLEKKFKELSGAHKKRDDTTTDASVSTTDESGEDDATESELRKLDEEIDALNSELHRPTVSFPNNVTVVNFIDYMLVPALVYDLEYPRTKTFRPLYLVSKIFATLGTFSLVYLTVRHYILPVLDDMKSMNYVDTLVQLLIPFMMCYLLVFYIIFECICNGFAEITRFADREFYDNWWNSTSFDEFARKWNKPVHEFLLRHVYLESLHSLRMSKTNATLVTFFLSSLMHEAVMAVVGKRVRLYLFGMQMFQLPLIYMARIPAVRKQKLIGNIIFWFGMFLGPPLLAVAYCWENYA
ncbi:MBOAT, membrane-bound O-acyltransferase family-domain-containing protein, partial [Cladochytrium replicatum]